MSSDDAPQGADEQRDDSAARRDGTSGNGGDGGGSGRGWRIAAGVSVIAAVVAVGTLGYLLLTAGSGSTPGDVRACIPKSAATITDEGGHATDANCPPQGARYIDGLVQDATATGFVLVTMDGERETFAVRPPDRPYIDVQHAQSHASIGQPIRIWLQKVDGREVIVYLTDTPLNEWDPS